MKQLRLTNEDIALVCRTLAQLYHAGIGAGDALALMAEDEPAREYKLLLSDMARRADEGGTLSEIFGGAGCFPAYLCSLLEAGERVGKTEESLDALALYYEGRARMERRIKTALLYPAVLLIVLFAVVFILLVWVLPVFGDVYARLGSSLSGVAGGLLALGAFLRRALPAICVLLGLVIAAAAVLAAAPKLRDAAGEKWRSLLSDKGVNRAINTARLAQALAMGLGSGMTETEALSMAVELTRGGEGFNRRCEKCREMVGSGESLAHALRETELLRSADCRLLEAGARSGGGDRAMRLIADRLLEESEEALEQKVGRIEPALVVVISVLVGAILLSVMLPLMHIMNAIG